MERMITMKKALLLLALTLANAIAASPVFAKIPPQSGHAYNAAGSGGYVPDRHYGAQDIQIYRPRNFTGPQTVHEDPFRSKN
jgi:hypothetical protein